MIERAGFWRRALAFTLDGLAVTVALDLLAFVAFPLSNGYVQASLGIQQTTCHKLAAPPAEFDVPPEFGANLVVTCQAGLFGLPTARTTTIAHQTREGSVTKSLWLGFMVDEQGRPIHGLSLNILVLPLLIALRWWADRNKGSPGRRLCRISIVGTRDDEADRPRSALSRRYTAFMLPVIPIALFTAYQTTFVSFAMFQHPALVPTWIGSSLIAAIPMVWSISDIIYRKDAFYDRFAGTAVQKRSAPKAVA